MPQLYEILVEARDSASQTFANVARNAEQAARRVNRAGGAKAPLTGLAALKDTFGGRSDFKDVVELIKGGGAIAGLGLAGSVFGDLGEAARDLTKAYQDGTINANELSQKLIEAIPVIGGFARGIVGLVDAAVELSESQKEYRRQQKEVEGADRARVERRDSRKERKSFGADIEAFAGSLGETSEERLNAAFASQMRQLDELEKKAKESGANTGLVIEQRIAAEEKYRRDLKKIAEGWEDIHENSNEKVIAIEAKARQERLRNLQDFHGAELDEVNERLANEERAIEKQRKEMLDKIGTSEDPDIKARRAQINADLDKQREAAREAAKGSRVGSTLAKFFDFETDPEFRTEREKRQAIDDALEKFFEFESEVPEFRKAGVDRRFATATESRGTGIGALARTQQIRDPVVDAAKEGNKIALDQKTVLERIVTEVQSLASAMGGTTVYNGVGNA